MRWAYHIKYKIRTAIVLTALIVVILLSNLSEYRSFQSLDKSVASVVDDRLMPATYLFKITNALYKKRMLHEASDTHTPTERASLINKHNISIDSCIKEYESTVLTTEEKQQWISFKQDLASYNSMEIAWLNDSHKNDVLSITAINTQFNNIIHDLDQLTNIQIGEGSNIRKNSASIVNSNELLSNLEYVAVIVLSLFTLVLLSISDKALFKGQQQQALN